VGTVGLTFKIKNKPQCSQPGCLALLLCLVACVVYVHPVQAVDTYRILALRVSFPQESPDEETTSGNGTFDLRTFADVQDSLAYPFDMPPHNRIYFEAHLQALTNYYNTASNGQLAIQYDVFPRAENNSYELTTPLIDYGNGRTRNEVSERIVRLFRDGILAADVAEADNLDFSQYDAFAIFHAGLGGEASQALNDIPSAFISQSDLIDFVEGSIAVDNGAFTITSGMLLPEAISTSGRGGLNGTLARFFASQLGLPGLSDFENDLPAVGDWSLMDTGANNLIEADKLGLQPLSTTSDNDGDDRIGTTLIGFLPSLPMVWSRVKLGWTTPITVTRSDTLQIVAAHIQSDLPQAVKVPLSATEYFLIENRISRLTVHSQTPTIQLSQPNGVWLSVDDQDAFIPGSGILIWHIDDTVINASGDRKNINSNPDYEIAFTQYRRGIALEEADGLLDIGNVSASRVVQNGIISFSAIEGSENDPFYIGNNATIGPETTPNTNSNLSYATGVTIEILSPQADTMTVAIRFAQQQDNWPITGLAPNPNATPRAMDLNNDGKKEILRGITEETEIYSAWGLLGVPLSLPSLNTDNFFRFSSSLPPTVGEFVNTAEGLELLYHDSNANQSIIWNEPKEFIHAISDFISPPFPFLSTPPVIAIFPDTPVDIWGWSDGRIGWGVFSSLRRGSVALPSEIQSLAVGNIDTDPDNELIAVTDNGQVHLISGANQNQLIASLDPIIGSPAIGDLDQNGTDDIAVVTSNGQLYVLTAEGIAYQSDPVIGGATSSPVLADLDNDGFIEVLFGGMGRIWVFRFNGTLQNGGALSFPLKDESGAIQASPIIADINADGTLEIIIGSPGGLIYGLTATGGALAGFPLSVPGPIYASPLIDDLDNDGTLELVTFTTNGAIQLFHLENIDPSYIGNQVIWGQLGGGSGNTGKLQLPRVGVIDPPVFTELLPEKRAYVYPNPIRNGDRAKIRFYLSGVADIRAVIYNPLGEKVDDLTHSNPLPNTENEIAWDVSDYASGFYICRLEASNGTQRDVRFIKVAVIK
jgi:M6 family metalloprotease-like protein